MLTEIEQHRNTALREADGYANIIAPQTEGPGLILKGQNDALRDYLKTPFNDEIRHNHFTLGQCWATNEAMIMTHIGNAAGWTTPALSFREHISQLHSDLSRVHDAYPLDQTAISTKAITRYQSNSTLAFGQFLLRVASFADEQGFDLENVVQSALDVAHQAYLAREHGQ